MSTTTLSLGLMIGAALSSGFGSVIGSASSKVAQLQEKCQRIKIGISAGREFQDLRDQTLKVRKEFEASGYKSKELGQQLVELQRRTVIARTAAQQYGIKINNVSQETKYLGIVSQQTEAKIGRMQARMARAQARSAMKGELLSVVGMGYAIGRAVQPAIRFEESFADVKKVVSGSDAMITNLRRDALGLTRELPMAGEEINKIMAAAAQSGVSGRTAIVDFTRTTAKMGVAFDISAEEAGAAMAEIKNSCGLTQPQMVNLGDAMNYLSNNTASSAADIVEYMRRVGAVGKIVNMTEVQMAALGATFRAAGTPAEVAARATNDLIMKLANASQLSDKTRAAFARLGYGNDLTKLERSMRIDPQKTILGFLDRVASQKNVLGALYGTIGSGFSDDIAKLVKGRKQYAQAIGLVAKKENYAGSMEKEFQARAKTTANAIQLMKNKLAITSIHLGSVFLPMIVDVVNKIGAVTDKFSKWAEKNPQLVKTIGALVVGFVGMKAATLGFKWLGSYVLDGLSMMNGGFQMLRPSVIQAHLAVLRMKGAGSVVGGIVSTIGGRFSRFKTGFLNDISAVKSGLSTVGSIGKTGLLKLAGGLKSTAVVIGSFTKTSLIALGHGIRTMATVIIGAMRAIGASMLANPLGWIIGAIALAAVIIWKWKEVKAFFGGLWKAIKTACAPIGEAIKAPFVAAFGWIGNKIEWLKTKWTTLKNVLGGSVSQPAPGPGKAGASMPGHAIGGIFDKPHIAAISEGGRKEAVIPLEGNAARARSIYTTAGNALGIRQQPANNGSYTINANFTISAQGNDAEKIAACVKQALADLERKAKSRERGRFADAPVFG